MDEDKDIQEEVTEGAAVPESVPAGGETPGDTGSDTPAVGEPPAPADGATTEGPAAPERAEEYLAGWKRAAADYANLKRDLERLRQEYAKYAAQSFCEKLLPAVDNLKKACDQKPDLAEGSAPADAVGKWIEGIGHVRDQFDSVLKEAGVTAIAEVEVPFDPSIHEAVMRDKREGLAADTVAEVVEPGYRLHDRIIRPAKVIVAE